MLDVVVFLVSLGVRVIRAMCRRRADLMLENVALRQQVTALKKERPRPPLEDTERVFWVALRGSWPVWASRLLIVHADTVARWHRDRFRRYWAKISQRRHPTAVGTSFTSTPRSTRRLLGLFSNCVRTFPYDTAPKYLIFDRDFIFSAAVIEFIKATGTKPVRTSFRSPWQNGTAERWVGSCRRELLEHVVVLGACHLIRLVRAYISYYHEDRCHLGLNKDTPSLRAVTHRPSPTAKVVALPRVGGLHHRYEWREAA